MAVNFSHLLNKPAGEAEKPKPIPAGVAPGFIKSFETGDSNANKTPYVRFHLTLAAFPEGTDPDDVAGIELATRRLRKDFFLTDDALWRLDELLVSFGLDLGGRTYLEVLPETAGKPVLVEVQQYINQQNGDIGNQVGKLTAA